MKAINDRNSSIELLRILLIGGVIVLHYIADSGQLLNNAIQGSLPYYLLIFMNQLCVCAVDVFIIISGFYSCKSNRIHLSKLLQLLLQVVLFQILASVGVSLIRGKSITIANVIYNIIPRNYYVTLYISLMLLAPFLNIFISKLTKTNFKKFLITIACLFLVEPTLVDIVEGIKGTTIYGISTIGILGAEWGYTIVTFICVYFIAAYIRIYGSFWSTKWNFIVWFTSLMFLFIWKSVEVKIGVSIAAEHYMNPVLVVNGIAVFEIFRNLDFKSRLVNLAAKGCFTVFLLHGYLISYFDVKKYLNDNIFIFLAQWLISVVVIFFICDVIGLIYTSIENVISKKISNKKIGYEFIEIDN